jgi:hypothetical protein
MLLDHSNMLQNYRCVGIGSFQSLTQSDLWFTDCKVRMNCSHKSYLSEALNNNCMSERVFMNRTFNKFSCLFSTAVLCSSLWQSVSKFLNCETLAKRDAEVSHTVLWMPPWQTAQHITKVLLASPLHMKRTPRPVHPRVCYVAEYAILDFIKRNNICVLVWTHTCSVRIIFSFDFFEFWDALWVALAFRKSISRNRWRKLSRPHDGKLFIVAGISLEIPPQLPVPKVRVMLFVVGR